MRIFGCPMENDLRCCGTGILVFAWYGGLGAHLPLSAATDDAGYRYQFISTEFDEPFQDASDITKGFAVGVKLSF